MTQKIPLLRRDFCFRPVPIRTPNEPGRLVLFCLKEGAVKTAPSRQRGHTHN